MNELPPPIRSDMARAQRLEWWTLAGMGSIVAVMYLAMGGSQAMKTAFLEDLLGLIPAMTFLIAAKLEPREPTTRYRYGFVRVNSLAFLASAVVLTTMGLWLLFDGVSALLMNEHPSIGPLTIFGHTIWLGWVMIAALAYSVVIPMILGRLKLPVAKRLRDKVLHTDADMQKADWQTGLAGILGIIGVGLGFWWADSLAAALISLSILADGFRNLRVASAELLDSVPRALDSADMAEDAERLQRRLERRWPEGEVRLRESGRYIFASVEGVASPPTLPSFGELMGDDPAWRLARLTFSPERAEEEPEETI